MSRQFEDDFEKGLSNLEDSALEAEKKKREEVLLHKPNSEWAKKELEIIKHVLRRRNPTPTPKPESRSDSKKK